MNDMVTIQNYYTFYKHSVKGGDIQKLLVRGKILDLYTFLGSCR